MKTTLRFALPLLAALALGACGPSEQPADPGSTPTPANPTPVTPPAPPVTPAPAPMPERHAAAPRRRANAGEVASAEAIPVCADCGTVSAIEEKSKIGKGSGLGAIGGAVLGGVLGHQFGGGKGKTAATAAGAIAGGVGGNYAERKIRADKYYEVTVTMESGGTRTVKVQDASGITVGSKVRVVGENIELRS